MTFDVNKLEKEHLLSTPGTFFTVRRLLPLVFISTH